MKVFKILEGAVANVTTDSFVMPVDASKSKDEMLVQIDIPGTATVAIEGRLHSDLPWVEILSVAAGGLYPLAFMPHTRVVLSGWASGATSAYVGWF